MLCVIFAGHKLYINPLKGRGVNWLYFAIQVRPTFLISDIPALTAERQSARMSEIKNVG